MQEPLYIPTFDVTMAWLSIMQMKRPGKRTINWSMCLVKDSMRIREGLSFRATTGGIIQPEHSFSLNSNFHGTRGAGGLNGPQSVEVLYNLIRSNRDLNKFDHCKVRMLAWREQLLLRFPFRFFLRYILPHVLPFLLCKHSAAKMPLFSWSDKT